MNLLCWVYSNVNASDCNWREYIIEKFSSHYMVAIDDVHHNHHQLINRLIDLDISQGELNKANSLQV